MFGTEIRKSVGFRLVGPLWMTYSKFSNFYNIIQCIIINTFFTLQQAEYRTHMFFDTTFPGLTVLVTAGRFPFQIYDFMIWF